MKTAEVQMKSNYHYERQWVLEGMETLPDFVKGLQVGFLSLGLGCHQTWKVPAQRRDHRSPEPEHLRTRAWHYVWLPAPRPECHQESTSPCFVTHATKVRAPISTSILTGEPTPGLPCSHVESVLTDSPLQVPDAASASTPSPAPVSPPSSTPASCPSHQWSRGPGPLQVKHSPLPG